MDTDLTWTEMAIRLACACVAGAVIGFDRAEKGKPAGLRTTIIVCLAACIAMIQANVLFASHLTSPDNLVRMDVLRFPLGVLSGIGFIGAGAILRRGDLLLGVTTAASLWLTTILGLCFGAGHLSLGAVGTALAFVILWGVKLLDDSLRRERRALLVLRAGREGPEPEAVRSRLKDAGLDVSGWAQTYGDAGAWREIRCEVAWRDRDEAAPPPAIFHSLASAPGILQADWSPVGVEAA